MIGMLVKATELDQLRTPQTALEDVLRSAERQAEGRFSSRVENLRTRIAVLIAQADGIGPQSKA
jgi:hypothetical protein